MSREKKKHEIENDRNDVMEQSGSRLLFILHEKRRNFIFFYLIICKKGIDNVKKNFIMYLYKKHK